MESYCSSSADQLLWQAGGAIISHVWTNCWLWEILIMVRCVLSRLKPSELYILSFGKSHGLRPRPFPQLRMSSSEGFILYWNTIGYVSASREGLVISKIMFMPTNIKHGTNVGLMLGQRRTRWTNIKQCSMFCLSKPDVYIYGIII